MMCYITEEEVKWAKRKPVGFGGHSLVFRLSKYEHFE